MSEHIQVKIPVRLYKAVEAIVLQTEDYKTPAETVCHVLREFAPNYKENIYSDEEQEELQQRLRSLGYL